MLLPSLPYHQPPPSLLASALPYNYPLSSHLANPVLSTPPSERILDNSNGFESSFDIDLQAVVEKCRALQEMIGMYRCSVGVGGRSSRAMAERSGSGDVKGGSWSGSGKRKSTRRGKGENKILKVDRKLQSTRITTTTTITTKTPLALALLGSNARKPQTQTCTNNNIASTTDLHLHLLHNTPPCTPLQYHSRVPPHLPLGLSRADFSLRSPSKPQLGGGGKSDQLELELAVVREGVGEVVRERELETWELI